MSATINAQEADFVHNVLVANNVINSNGSGIWLGINPGSGGPPLYTKWVPLLIGWSPELSCPICLRFLPCEDGCCA